MELPEKNINDAEVKEELVKVLMPLNGRVLFLKDEDESKTKGGIVLPDSAKIPVLTGIILAISKDVRDNPVYGDIKVHDRIVVNYAEYVPVDFKPGNRRFFLPVTSIIAVWKDADDDDLE